MVCESCEKELRQKIGDDIQRRIKITGDEPYWFGLLVGRGMATKIARGWAQWQTQERK